ncbi:hypothetical protein ACET3Z_025122 [Daucus carota]
MDSGQHQYHHLHHQLQHQQISDAGGDRFPQWSIQETGDFLMIRAELDPNFMETKRNKALWEVVATKMKEKGYNRSAEQCKCKWKNLVTRYKGCETMEPEGVKQQFPFYNELQTIFAARMQRMVWNEAEGGFGGSKKKALAQLSSDDEDDNIEESDGDQKGTTAGKKKKRKANRNTPGTSNTGGGNVNNSVDSIKETLQEFLKQQAEMEMRWMNGYEAREEERRIREIEWRQRMEALENERIMTERSWREREEQRRVREEGRAEKRDALITALLNKLRREDNTR